jgi:CRISPR/Cas system-associated endonuclease/helicase Cas3
MVAYYLNDVEDHSILLQHFKSLFYGLCSSYSDGFENYLPQISCLKKLPKILVSTQVMEVSLDIDFEQGFTEPAPIDAIVQELLYLLI